MRSSKSRSRNKSNRQRTLGNVVNRVFDSSGPEGKVRGTPQQIIDKYLTLARDAQLSNDRVAEQSFLQHAEHYTRMLGEAQREQAERQAQHQNNNGQNHRGPGDEDRGDHGRGGYQQGQGRGDQPAQDGDNHDETAEQQPYRAPSRPMRDQHVQRDEPVARDDNAQENAQEGGLPDALGGSDEGESSLVETPESQPRPKRAPRAPRAENRAPNRTEGTTESAPRGVAPRARRKPAPKPDAAAAPEATQD